MIEDLRVKNLDVRRMLNLELAISPLRIWLSLFVKGDDNTYFPRLFVGVEL